MRSYEKKSNFEKLDGRGMYWKTYLGNTGVQACPEGKPKIIYKRIHNAYYLYLNVCYL